jgi:hypothetical protein
VDFSHENLDMGAQAAALEYFKNQIKEGSGRKNSRREEDSHSYFYKKYYEEENLPSAKKPTGKTIKRSRRPVEFQ